MSNMKSFRFTNNDDQLLAKAKKLTGCRTDTDTVRKALLLVIQSYEPLADEENIPLISPLG